jgi:hypothetical protein
LLLFGVAVVLAIAASLLVAEGRRRSASVAALLLTALGGLMWVGLVVIDLTHSNKGGPDCSTIPQHGEHGAIIVGIIATMIPALLVWVRPPVIGLRLSAGVALVVEAGVIAASFAYIVTANPAC